METKHDLAIRHTQTSKARIEGQKAQVFKPGHTSGTPARERVVSHDQREVQLALEAVQSSPEARTRKIDALRTLIESGSYHINSTSLAMKLLGITEQDAR